MSDPRFTRLRSDPRFRRPKVKQTKVVIDERFNSIFKRNKTKKSVDKYGRAVSASRDQDDLHRYYRLADVSDQDLPRKPDLARGEVLMESSDEEGEQSEEDSDVSGFVTLGENLSNAARDEYPEINLNEDSYADLDEQAAQYSREHQDDAARDREQHPVQTSRLAIVNLDWEHVRAHHLYKICASLVSPNASITSMPISSSSTGRKKRSGGSIGGPVNVIRGNVLSVRVYPSDFGKERMAKEEKEGPPAEIFKKREDLTAEEVNETTIFEVGGEEDYNEDALRKYQLERLRYYYAIVECDTVDAAAHIYTELDGTELERSANIFDISFVPEGMTFENTPRDEALDSAPEYKAVEFVTDALRHSKVKLTWDDEDPERHQVTRRALTKKEIEENDFAAYIANSSSGSESDGEPKAKAKRKVARERMRSLLLGGNDEEIPEGWGDESAGDMGVDMEVTFTPGLSEKKSEEDETTLERYQRKLKEKRKKKKGETKAVRAEESAAFEDEFFDNDADSSDAQPQPKSTVTSTSDGTAEEMIIGASSSEPKHFNIKSVIKAEKSKKRRPGRKGKVEQGDNEAQEDFVVNVKDERFKALYEDHQLAIDPTNPHFKKTKAMVAFLDERRKRGNTDDNTPNRQKSRGDGDNRNDLKSLVESVKRKSSNVELSSAKGKRMRL